MSQAGDRPEDDEDGKRDVVLISGIDRARNEVHVLKPAEDGIEAAVLRQVEDGVPLTGDLVRLHPHKSIPFLAELETVLRHPDNVRRAGRGHNGPPMVASEAYRRGWDAIFATRPTAKDDKEAN